MATSQVIFLMSLLLFSMAFYSVTADRDEEGPIKALLKKSIVVEGMVYCQSCKALGTLSLSGAEPIPEAKVSVTCTNHKNYIFYYNIFTANEDGYFYAKLDGFKMEHHLLDHPLTSCKVTLVSSPQENCNVRTNVNYGISEASLYYEQKRLNKKDCDVVIYAAGPFAFRPAQCTSDEIHY